MVYRPAVQAVLSGSAAQDPSQLLHGLGELDERFDDDIVGASLDHRIRGVCSRCHRWRGGLRDACAPLRRLDCRPASRAVTRADADGD